MLPTTYNEYEYFPEQDMEVDYDYNPTDLYMCISDSKWHEALQSIKENPIQAKIWVVKTDNRYKRNESICRFLPIHSACARGPPMALVTALLEAYPEGLTKQDDNGMCPLHYACANLASANVVGLLLNVYPDANFLRAECSGALPIHMSAQWGISSIQVFEILLEGNKSLATARDSEGLSTIDLAVDAEHHEHKNQVIKLLKDALIQDMLDESSTLSSLESEDVEEQEATFSRGDRNLKRGSTPKKNDPISLALKEEGFAAEASKLTTQLCDIQKVKTGIQKSAKDQIAYEWEAVNIALKEMGKKSKFVNKLEKEDDKYRQENKKGLPNDYAAILKENEKIEKELKTLKSEYSVYHSKIETVESILKELTDAMTRVASGHKKTLTRLDKMEHEMSNVTKIRAEKLSKMTSEVELMASKSSKYSATKDERKGFRLSNKEEEILDRISVIIHTLKA
jgi:hypothetical protein